MSIRSGHGMSSSSPSANAVTISGEELYRMRALAEDDFKMQIGSSSAEAQLRASRKKASEERAGRWPNTLEALRHKKDQTRKDMIAAKEAEMIAEDAVSQAKRDEARRAAIAAAQSLVKQQSEKFKIIANYQSRSHDMDLLAKQTVLKAQMAEARRREEEAYHQALLADLARATEDDGKKLEEARAKAKRQVAEQQRQVAAMIERRIATIKETEEEGRRMLAEIEVRNQASYAQAVAKREEGALKLKQFGQENAKLQAIRAELKKSEGEMLVWITEQAKVKEEQDARIKVVIERQREESKRKAAIISDLMARDYASRQNTEDVRLANEIAAADAKTAAAAAEKARKQAEMKASIEFYIQQSREKAFAAIRQQMSDDAKQHEEFQKKLAVLEAAEAQAANTRRARASEFRLMWLKEAAEKKHVREEIKAAAVAEAKSDVAGALGGPEDAEFAQAIAQLEESERAKGHSVRPLHRMVHKVTNPPLIANMRR